MIKTKDGEVRLEPCISIQHGLVVNISDSFAAITGYDREELVYKSILHVLNDMLRINKKIKSIEEITSIESCFIFNKLEDFKEFSIEVLKDIENDSIYLYFEQRPLISIDNPLSYTHQIICNSITGVALYNADDFTLLKASDEYKKIMFDRYGQSDIVGKKVYEFSPGWWDSIDKTIWENVIQTQKPYNNVERSSLNPHTNEIEYYDNSVTPIIDKGKVKFFIVTLSNVTEKVRYRLENEKKARMIEKQKELLEAVIENQSVSIYIIDTKGNIVISNKEGKERYYPHQIKTIQDMYEAAELFDINNNRLELEQTPIYRVTTGEKIENEIIRVNVNGKSRYINLNGTPIYNNGGTFEYVFMSGADITELVESRQLIERQKEQLEVTMKNMSDALLIVDKNGKFIMQNKAALYYFGRELKQVGDALNIAKYYEMNGKKIPRDKMPGALLLKGIETRDKVIHIKFPEKEMYVSVSATPIFDQQGDYIMGVMSIRDITEYIKDNETISKQQQALLEAEKRERENLQKMMEMKDEFLSLISHEFRTPLTVINSALQTLELVYSDQLTEKVKSYLNKIKQNTYRQVRLVNNLLDITRANAGHLKLNMRNMDVVFITKVIVESVSLYANQKGVNIHFISEFKKKYIALDDEKYERILLNLLANAVKFTPKGKCITVELTKKDDSFIVKVEDQGIGIQKEKQDLIFERFGQVENTFTRQAEGSGIGLSLVKQIVNAMGGQIYVESEPGVGSSFFVELPDKLVCKASDEVLPREQIDTRLIQSIAIEFSDIYF